jgi:hypothetical protein
VWVLLGQLDLFFKGTTRLYINKLINLILSTKVPPGVSKARRST